MIVLGIDPGTVATGYGVVERRDGVLRHLDHGVIRTSSKEPLWIRLGIIHTAISEVLDAHRPDVLSLERCFVSRNVQSALKLGHARGAVMVAAVSRGVDVAEYTPGQVKQAVTGHGRAEKAQVQEMVRVILSLVSTAPEDASDALAAAICHLNGDSFQGRLEAAR
ncbi:MAG: crossover junction endodeoxyribonuclease RuvC [Myxococcota bacterium]|nr:crossover junction endodeoxyribonuclease RuvC [Myxococcota bacterium]